MTKLIQKQFYYLKYILPLLAFGISLSFNNCAPSGFETANSLSTIQSCQSGEIFDAETNVCKQSLCSPSQTIACTGMDPNGIYSASCNTSGTSYGSCSLTSCIKGYTLIDGQCKFEPSTWRKVDSNATFDFMNGGHLYYVNHKIVILSMNVSAHFYVYDIATKKFISTPPVPSPTYPSIYDRATSFALGDSVYIILGTTLWEYKTITNSWTNKGTVPGNDHRRAFSFSVNGYAYVNGGFYNEGKTFKYSPTNNQWTQVKDHTFINASEEHGSYFVLNKKAYIYDGTLTEYDPSTDTWTDKNSQYFVYYATFAMNGKGYLVGSPNKYDKLNKLYGYDPNNDV